MKRGEVLEDQKQLPKINIRLSKEKHLEYKANSNN